MSKAQTGNGETILLVDDEEEIRRTYANILQVLGYRVITVCDGEEALGAFDDSSDEIDLVVMDVVMPKVGGIEAVRVMRQKRSSLPVIFITGYERGALEEYSVIPGIRVLPKPVTLRVFEKNVRELLGS